MKRVTGLTLGLFGLDMYIIPYEAQRLGIARVIQDFDSLIKLFRTFETPVQSITQVIYSMKF